MRVLQFILLKIQLNEVYQYGKKPAGVNITYDNNRIKQFHKVEYLGCYLDANLSEEPMAMKSLKRINA